MRRLLVILTLAGLAAMVGAISASADAVYHSEHLALSPVGNAPLRSGFVENIHADGPNVYAHEQYVLNGAAPNSSYQVVLMVFPTDTTWGGARPAVASPTPPSQTHAAGNGHAVLELEHVCRQSDSDDHDQRCGKRQCLSCVHAR